MNNKKVELGEPWLHPHHKKIAKELIETNIILLNSFTLEYESINLSPYLLNDIPFFGFLEQTSMRLLERRKEWELILLRKIFYVVSYFRTF